MADHNRNGITTFSYLKFLAARPKTTPANIGFQAEELHYGNSKEGYLSLRTDDMRGQLEQLVVTLRTRLGHLTLPFQLKALYLGGMTINFIA